MVFSSNYFLLCFLPLLLIIYSISDRKYKNGILLFFSIFFYSWGAPKFVFVILLTTLCDFHLVKWMWNTESPAKRKWILALSVSINLGLLIYFKYSGFFVENVNSMLSHLDFEELDWPKLVLPIGISFYTFETITYVVDVYRKIHKPLKNFWDYQLYIILFPKLIAGPIIRYHEIADQIGDRTANEKIDAKLVGFYRFIIGLSKKVLLANVVGQQADAIFSSNLASLDTYTAWIGIVSYSFQIYFDFSGYSDMAIGLGKMFGFNFPENFNNPYTSSSITDFWRNWHISLGNWMRNYLYIPLGGNRVKSKSRMYFNLWLVFLASGFWHGASWSFIVWGAYHGLLLVLERLFLLNFYKKTGVFFSTLFTFFLVVIGWVFFRVEKLADAFLYLQKMFEFNRGNSFEGTRSFYFIFMLALLFSFFYCLKPGKRIQQEFYFNAYSNIKHLGVAFVSVMLLIICVSAITANGFNPFIYFRF